MGGNPVSSFAMFKLERILISDQVIVTLYSEALWSVCCWVPMRRGPEAPLCACCATSEASKHHTHRRFRHRRDEGSVRRDRVPKLAIQTHAT